MDTRAIGISCTWAAGQSAVQHLSLPRQRRFSPKDGLVPRTWASGRTITLSRWLESCGLFMSKVAWPGCSWRMPVARPALTGRGQVSGKIRENEGGWKNVVAPSALPFADNYPMPQALSVEGIKNIISAFVAAARRACEAGFRVIEIHAAHGYLIHEFLSPLSNQRTDAYGGSFENRTRIVREIVAAVRGAWPERAPLFVRISATDWVDGGWDIQQSVELAGQLKELGADLIDCSSGGNVLHAKIPVGPGYQTNFAEQIRREAEHPDRCRWDDHVSRSGRAHRL